MWTVELYDKNTWLKSYGMWQIPVKARVLCSDGKLRTMWFNQSAEGTAYCHGRTKVRRQGKSYTVAGILSIRPSNGETKHELHFVSFSYRKNGHILD